jgi:putative transcriptional regulator
VSEGGIGLRAGRLLVAAPVLHDPNFFRTVVLLIDHDEHGALGLVLNRPGDLAASEVVPRLAPLLADDAVLYVGGPVQQDGVIGLAEYRDPAVSGAQPIVGAVGVLDAEVEPEELGGGVAQVRAFQGYAGWGPGQLEAELAEEAWILAPAHPGDAFDDEPATLWRRALERRGGRFAMIGRMPEDPALN